MRFGVPAALSVATRPPIKRFCSWPWVRAAALPASSPGRRFCSWPWVRAAALPASSPGRRFCSSGLRVQGCKPLAGVWGRSPQFKALWPRRRRSFLLFTSCFSQVRPLCSRCSLCSCVPRARSLLSGSAKTDKFNWKTDKFNWKTDKFNWKTDKFNWKTDIKISLQVGVKGDKFNWKTDIKKHVLVGDKTDKFNWKTDKFNEPRGQTPCPRPPKPS